MSREMSKSQQKRFAAKRKKPEGTKQRTPRPPYDGDFDYEVIEKGVEEYHRQRRISAEEAIETVQQAVLDNFD